MMHVFALFVYFPSSTRVSSLLLFLLLVWCTNVCEMNGLHQFPFQKAVFLYCSPSCSSQFVAACFTKRCENECDCLCNFMYELMQPPAKIKQGPIDCITADIMCLLVIVRHMPGIINAEGYSHVHLRAPVCVCVCVCAFHTIHVKITRVNFVK